MSSFTNYPSTGPDAGIVQDLTPAAASGTSPDAVHGSLKRLYDKLAIFDPAGPYTGCVPTRFLKWRTALGKMRAANRDAKLLCVGDSTTVGEGTTPTSTKSYPAVVARLINSYAAPAAMGMIVPPRITPDTRWTAGSGWATGGGYGAGAASVYSVTGASGNLVCTPNDGATSDTFDVYYLQSSAGFGAFSATATGGSTTNVTGGNGTGDAIAKVTVTAASATTTNAVTIVCTSGSAYIVGVEPSLSTTRRVRVGNAGVGATQTSSWTANGFGGAGFIKSYAPDLTVISLGINDAGASVSASTFGSNMATIITAAQVSGDVLLMTMPPSSSGNGAAYVTGETAYQAVYRSLATTYNCGLFDLYARFGSTYQSTLHTDGLHPNEFGYADTGLGVFGAIKG